MWYEKLEGEPWAAVAAREGKHDSLLFHRATKKWRGWAGGNERRVEQRRNSESQTQVRLSGSHETAHTA